MRWEVKLLGEVCSKITDGSHNPPKGIESGRMMLSGRNLKEGRIVLNKYRFISQTAFDQENKRTYVEAGDVLMSIVGSIGEVVVFPKNMEQVAFQRSVAVMKPEPLINPFFLRYQLIAPEASKWLMSQARGAAQKGVYLKTLRGMAIPIPPLEEQERIVEVLDEAFAAIDKAKANIERNLTNARELFQSRLNDIFSNPSEDWEEKAIEEFALTTDYVSNGSFAALKANVTYHYEESFAILLRTTDYVKHWQKDFVYVDETSYHFLKKSSVQVGDLLISNVGKPGIAFLAPDLGRPMTIGPNAILIRCHTAVTNEFLLRFFQSSAGETLIGGITSGTTQLKFNKTNLRLSKVRFPTKTDQIMMVEELRSLEELSISLEHKYKSELDNLEELRQSILEQAFEGKLTEPVAA